MSAPLTGGSGPDLPLDDVDAFGNIDLSKAPGPDFRESGAGGGTFDLASDLSLEEDDLFGEPQSSAPPPKESPSPVPDNLFVGGPDALGDFNPAGETEAALGSSAFNVSLDEGLGLLGGDLSALDAGLSRGSGATSPQPVEKSPFQVPVPAPAPTPETRGSGLAKGTKEDRESLDPFEAQPEGGGISLLSADSVMGTGTKGLAEDAPEASLGDAFDPDQVVRGLGKGKEGEELPDLAVADKPGEPPHRGTGLVLESSRFESRESETASQDDHLFGAPRPASVFEDEPQHARAPRGASPAPAGSRLGGVGAAPLGGATPAAPPRGMRSAELAAIHGETAPEHAHSASLPARSPVGRRSGAKKGILAAIGLLIVLIGAGGYLWTQRRDLLLDLIQRAQSFVKGKPQATADQQPAGKIEVEDPKGEIKRVNDRNYFVITGTVKNLFSQPVSLIQVRGTLANGKGGKVNEKTVYAGHKIGQDDLQTKKAAEIDELLYTKFGDNLNNISIPTGTEIPFTIVFFDISPDVDNFEVTAFTAGERS